VRDARHARLDEHVGVRDTDGENFVRDFALNVEGVDEQLVRDYNEPDHLRFVDVLLLLDRAQSSK
jgi:hypothetical protein